MARLAFVFTPPGKTAPGFRMDGGDFTLQQDAFFLVMNISGGDG